MDKNYYAAQSRYDAMSDDKGFYDDEQEEDSESWDTADIGYDEE